MLSRFLSLGHSINFFEMNADKCFLNVPLILELRRKKGKKGPSRLKVNKSGVRRTLYANRWSLRKIKAKSFFIWNRCASLQEFLVEQVIPNRALVLLKLNCFRTSTSTSPCKRFVWNNYLIDHQVSDAFKSLWLLHVIHGHVAQSCIFSVIAEIF